MDVKALPDAVWHKDEMIRFQAPVQDTSGFYTVWLTVRNDQRYAFSNLWLFIRTTSPSGASIRDTIDIRLAGETGRWLGRGSSHKFTMELPLKMAVRFPLSGTYHFEIQHGMRDVELRSITDIGIRIEELK